MVHSTFGWGSIAPLKNTPNRTLDCWGRKELIAPVSVMRTRVGLALSTLLWPALCASQCSANIFNVFGFGSLKAPRHPFLKFKFHL